jgi:flagellar hook-length control protein FliK
VSAPDFAGLIPVDQATAPSRALGASTAHRVPTDLAATPAETELVSELSGLLEKLAGLSDKLKDGPLDEIDLEDLENLLACIETLFDQGAPLPLPESPAFAALSDLATALGVESTDSPTAPLDVLAGLSARIADGLRDEAPDLAARLTGLARALDGHAAAIQTALADEQAIAATSIRHIESETKLNAAATIEEQAGAEQKPAQPAPDAAPKQTTPPSDRSLVKDGQPAPTPEARPAQPQAGAAAATAPASPELEAPDGLTLGAPQAQTPTSGTSAAIRPEAALYQRPDAQINLPHIAAEISRHVQNGVSRFEIKLNPAELGRIDVRMEVDGSGNVVARLAVERSETLDLLQRDHRALERALADAGLDSAKTELEFSLQQQGGNTHDEPETSPWRTMVSTHTASEPSTPSTNADLNPYMRGYARLDAVNLWV